MYINSLFKQYHLNLIQIIIINNKINNARSSLCLIGFQVVKILLFSGMPFGSYFVCHFQFIWKYRKITMFCYYGTDAIVDVHETTVLYSPWNSFSLSVNLTLIDTLWEWSKSTSLNILVNLYIHSWLLQSSWCEVELSESTCIDVLW
jgi:hypothetical protein